MKNFFYLICLILLPFGASCQLFYLDSDDTLDFKYYPQRIDEMNRMITLDSNRLEYYVKRSILYYRLKNFTKSVEDNKRIIKKFGELESAYCNMGLSYCFLKDSANALPAIRKAISLDPKAVNYMNMGFIQLHFDNYACAIPPLKQALVLNDQYAKAYYYLGYAFMKSGNFAEAKTNYLKANELNTFYPEAMYNLGFIAKTENNFQEAISYFSTLLGYPRIETIKVQVLEQRGNCYEQLGETSKAAADFELAGALKRR
jgi:tetratricopeptide (TPR) repeat protein